MLFVKEKCHSKVPNLFLGVFVRGNKVDSFEMPEINIPTKDIYVKKLEFRKTNNFESYQT